MHCLEDDLELLEDVPAELKRLCCKMRHLDFRVEKALSEVREKSFEFFNIRNTLPQEEREYRIVRIHQSYQQIRKLSEDKIAIAEHLHLMLEKYQERISSHLSEIKYMFDTPELNESIQSAMNSQMSRQCTFLDYDSVSDNSSDAENIKSPSVSRMNGHQHARIPSNAQQTIVGSTSVNENIVFKTGISGNHPKQLQKRITHYFASLGEVPSSAISSNEHCAGPPKKKIPNMNMTLPSVRLEQFQTARKSALWKRGVKTAGASLAESQKRILPNTTKISQPQEEAKSRRKSFIFPTRIPKKTTKESKNPVFSADATLPITVSEMAPIKDRIKHCESLFVSSQEPITDYDDTINSRNSFVDILKVKSIEKEAFIWSDDEDY